MAVIADTGPLYALIDSSDAWHCRVTEWWRERTQNVVIPAVVLPEVSYLLQTRIGPAAELAFIQAVADGEFTIEALEPEDVVRAAVLLRDYADLPLGFVDAAVVAVAERLGARETPLPPGGISAWYNRSTRRRWCYYRGTRWRADARAPPRPTKRQWLPRSRSRASRRLLGFVRTVWTRYSLTNINRGPKIS